MNRTMRDDVIIRKSRVLRTMALNDDSTMSGETVKVHLYRLNKKEGGHILDVTGVGYS